MTAKLTQSRRQWMRWLWGAGLPSPHIAALVRLPAATVAEWLASPARRPGPVHFPRLARRQSHLVRNDTGRKARVLLSLGYGAPRIADVLRLDVGTVRDFARRSQSITGELLARPRDRHEQRGIDRTRRRTARARRLAAGRALWSHHGAHRDDDGYNTAIVTRAVAPTVELIQAIPATDVPPCPDEPTRWEPMPEWFSGERHGRHKLTWPDVQRIRRLHSAGASCRMLVRQFGVHPGTIAAIVHRRTWIEVDPPESHPASAPPIPIVPPAPAPKPPATKRRRWRPRPGEPRHGARGSGATHDDSDQPLPCPSANDLPKSGRQSLKNERS